MARDLDKRFKEVERLTRLGRTAAASRELRQIASESVRDPLVLNRIGDFLARNGQSAEAIVYYDRVAEDLARGGFLPRALAVAKKALRLAPDHLPALLLIAEIYHKQHFLGEARSHLLAAADRFLRARAADKARVVYERLVALEPKEPLHHIRLAETKALQSDREGAVEDLLAAGAELLDAGRDAEAERTYRRAVELGPGRSEAIAGLGRALSRRGRTAEAIRLVEEAARRADPNSALTGELFVLYEEAGHTDRSAGFLAIDRADGLGDEAFERMLRVHAERGSSEEAWRRVDGVLDRWNHSGRFDRLVPLLERLARIEGQEIPALERLRTVHQSTGNRSALAASLEALVRAYWSRSMHAEASSALEDLKKVAPRSSLVRESMSRGRAPTRETAFSKKDEAAPSARPSRTGGEAVPSALAGAVPGTPADREFVDGRMAEAAAFEKYHLFDQAVQKLREITTRFPGQVEAQQKLVNLLRTLRDRDGAREALVGLALARHAAGDTAGAEESARSACAQGTLSPSLRGALEAAGLIARETRTTRAPGRMIPRRPPEPVRATHGLGQEATEVGIDEEETERPVEALAAHAAGSGSLLEPPDDDVAEVAFFVEQGMCAEALDRIESLRKLGFGNARLEELERQARSPEATRDADLDVEIETRLDDESLEEIPGALGDDVIVAGPQESRGSVGAEQTVDEVFQIFKQHVATEVDRGDSRTHYELGIAYKEMGLTDDAMEEFRLATHDPGFYRDACSMLGLCHHERGNIPEAVTWYGLALDAAREQGKDLRGASYDLAEVLVQSGEPERALELFETVLTSDPDYRDVRTRVRDLRGRAIS